MKVSSGVTSYLYPLGRDVAAKRRSDDVTESPQQPRLVENNREEKFGSLVEQVVEGELLNNRQDLARDDVLRFSRVFQSADAGYVATEERMGFTSSHAIEQYRAHFSSDDTGESVTQGRQVDLYV